MAIRTTDELVEGIIEVNADIPLDPFIETASSLVDRVAAIANADDEVLTAAQLELIERWLSAHFYSLRDPRFTQEKAGSVGATYQSQFYKDQAIALDFTGTLAGILSGKKRRASLAWLGTAEEEVT